MGLQTWMLVVSRALWWAFFQGGRGLVETWGEKSATSGGKVSELFTRLFPSKQQHDKSFTLLRPNMVQQPCADLCWEKIPFCLFNTTANSHTHNFQHDLEAYKADTEGFVLENWECFHQRVLHAGSRCLCCPQKHRLQSWSLLAALESPFSPSWFCEVHKILSLMLIF